VSGSVAMDGPRPFHVRIGIDTGGTFTDYVLVDEGSGAIRTVKVPSTPDDPSDAIATGLAQLAGGRVSRLIVGTTIATNSLIQRNGPTVLYVTNRGFEDVPFIGRLDKERLYDLHWRKPKPLVLRRNCFGVAGRVNHHGTVVEDVAEADLDELRRALAAHRNGEDAVVAVCLLFSYLEPSHEQAVLSVVREALPDASVSSSHEVSPVWREYERASTTIADAYVKPAIEAYVDRVGAVLQDQLGLEGWNLLGSNGGYLSAAEGRARPAQLLVSGLAGGVIGARFYADAAGFASVFSIDMGGTSCDLGLVLDGQQQYAGEFNLAFGVPVTVPCVAVRTIGAGGGSIAWVDKGGLLRVGPQSAGAQPGPVAYGQGGAEPTLTDANLSLGRLNPSYFLGGAMMLDAGAAADAVGMLGDGLGLSAEALALAAVRTADENMANEIRLIAVERGLDPRDFALIAFGGAGPLHARAVAERLGIGTVLVPPHPGLCSAFGCAITDARVDRVQTYYARSDATEPARVAAAMRALEKRAVADLRRSVDVDAPMLRRSADMRYAGQNYELETALPEKDLERAFDELLESFEREHERQYGFRLEGEPIEIINLRVTAVRPEPPPPVAAPDGAAGAAPVEVRAVWFDAEGPVDCPIFRRDELGGGTELEGPAIIEEVDSTTLVFPGDRLTLHPSGSLLLTIGCLE
jgi:N-methylhydantoinase A